jgi:hypothetical protein
MKRNRFSTWFRRLTENAIAEHASYPDHAVVVIFCCLAGKDSWRPRFLSARLAFSARLDFHNGSK